jgi:hypothetical protein
LADKGFIEDLLDLIVVFLLPSTALASLASFSGVDAMFFCEDLSVGGATLK